MYETPFGSTGSLVSRDSSESSAGLLIVANQNFLCGPRDLRSLLVFDFRGISTLYWQCTNGCTKRHKCYKTYGCWVLRLWVIETTTSAPTRGYKPDRVKPEVTSDPDSQPGLVPITFRVVSRNLRLPSPDYEIIGLFQPIRILYIPGFFPDTGSSYQATSYRSGNPIGAFVR